MFNNLKKAIEKQIYRLFQARVFLLGLAGNHPFSTLLRCWKTSPMLQNEENATTPNKIETTVDDTSMEAMQKMMPANIKSHQLFTPK